MDVREPRHTYRHSASLEERGRVRKLLLCERGATVHSWENDFIFTTTTVMLGMSRPARDGCNRHLQIEVLVRFTA